MYYKIGIFVALSVLIPDYVHGKGLGSTCFLAWDCGLRYFVCENNVCKCDARHIPDKHNVECVVDFNTPCEHQDKCFDDHANCVGAVGINVNGECKCNEGYTLDEKKMTCQVVIGNNCTSSYECIEGKCKLPKGKEDEEEIKKQCLCDDALESNVIGSKCLPKLGDECSAYGECARENSVCRYNLDAKKKICECADNYKEADRNGTIFCLAMLDNTCKNATYCADEGTACVPKNETENPAELSFNNNRRHNEYTYTGGIYFPEEPIPEPTKYCVCDTGFVRHSNVSTCLKVATKLNDTCIDNVQCTSFSGFGSVCKKGHCECNSGFYFDVDFDRCVRSCLCPDQSKLQDIVDVFQDLKPALEVFARYHNIDVSKLITKINNL